MSVERVIYVVVVVLVVVMGANSLFQKVREWRGICIGVKQARV